MSGKFGVHNPFSKWKRGDHPCDPHVVLLLNELNQEKDGRIRLTPTLTSDSEIDYEINNMKKDLEYVGKEAKRVLKAQREKIRSSF